MLSPTRGTTVIGRRTSPRAWSLSLSETSRSLRAAPSSTKVARELRRAERLAPFPRRSGAPVVERGLAGAQAEVRGREAGIGRDGRRDYPPAPSSPGASSSVTAPLSGRIDPGTPQSAMTR